MNDESDAATIDGLLPECLLWADGPLALPHNAVAVWALTDEVVQRASIAFAGLLSVDEVMRAAAYKRQPDRTRFIGRRGALRWLAGRYFAKDPASLCFTAGEAGKPGLQCSEAARCAFSVSRTEDLTVLSFGRAELVGVDVERAGRSFDHAAVARYIFSDAEQRRLEDAQDDTADVFLQTWTRKEALLKALGTGLFDAAKHYTTQDHPRGGAYWRAWHGQTPMSGWTCVDLPFGAAYRGALAVSAPGADVTLYACS
jgi:4'-phosphopantetheinyl transferase